MTNADYEKNEFKRFAAKVAECNNAPLAYRKAAQVDCLELMRMPEIVGRNINWILAGNYGFAEQKAIERIAAMKRGNKAAHAMQLLALLDCGCPAVECVKAWKMLSDVEKTALDRAILSELNEPKGE